LEEENIKMNPKEGMHWIYAVQDRDWLQAFVNTALNFWVL
jgi:hypothetical protein